MGFPVVYRNISTEGQNTTFELTLEGQETLLPLILLWRSASFIVPLSISFSPPIFSVATVSDAALIGTTLVEVHLGMSQKRHAPEVTLTNVPTVSDLASATGGFGTPENSMQLFITKRGILTSSSSCAAEARTPNSAA